jgi:hypothetical protein
VTLLLQAFIQRRFQEKVSKFASAEQQAAINKKVAHKYLKGLCPDMDRGLFGYVGSELNLNTVKAAADFKSIRASYDFT